jgi:hypothetical protein
VALIHRALCVGKSAGRNHLRSCLHHGGFKSCPADPDVWMRSAIKSDGTEVYEYVLVYTDDALSIGVEAESILRKEIGKYFELKEKTNWTSQVVPWRSSESGRIGQWSQGLGLPFFSICESCSSECGGFYCQGRNREVEAFE